MRLRGPAGPKTSGKGRPTQPLFSTKKARHGCLSMPMKILPENACTCNFPGVFVHFYGPARSLTTGAAAASSQKSVEWPAGPNQKRPHPAGRMARPVGRCKLHVLNAAAAAAHMAGLTATSAAIGRNAPAPRQILFFISASRKNAVIYKYIHQCTYLYIGIYIDPLMSI